LKILCKSDTDTYIHKEYLYRAYYPNSKSLYALRSLNKKVFTCTTQRVDWVGQPKTRWNDGAADGTAITN